MVKHDKDGDVATCPVSGATGTRDLYLNFTGGSGFLFNVDWWQFAV
ncbi:carbohydrate-binding protein [Glycomyces luteolus]|uniref:Carbohydrate-binding protein n=1 Tax=Glycomyces luteolus TaxID=2670330 RepID=A0A9X3PF33_9ACTN|nr:carbohydrate-binding protein [Glycomyces luteolus]MDA1362310.1 carbohydrate-binding protein [Glycomyces luteolus]